MMERPQKATALLLSLLGLFLVAHARSRYEAEDVDISLNVDKQPMEDLLQHMRAILSDNEPQLYVGGHPYLAPKDGAPGSPPCRWINVHLHYPRSGHHCRFKNPLHCRILNRQWHTDSDGS